MLATFGPSPVRPTHLAWILAEHAKYPGGHLLNILNLGQTSVLALEIVIEGANVQRFVDLAVASLVLLHGGHF
jgi:hypothetical protein